MMGLGYALQAVTSGEDASGMLDTVQPDYIIFDWSAPDMSGAVMIAAAHAQPHLKSVPFLVITGPDANPAQREILRGFNIPAVSIPLTEQNLLNSFDKILADQDG